MLFHVLITGLSRLASHNKHTTQWLNWPRSSPAQPSPAQPSQPSQPAAQLWSKLATLQIEVWSLDPRDPICIVFCSRIKGTTWHLGHLTVPRKLKLYLQTIWSRAEVCVFIISVFPHPHTGDLNDNPGLVPAEVWTKAWCITSCGWGWSLVSVSERSKCHCLMDYGRCPRTLPPVATMGQVPAAHNMTTQ